MNKEVSFKLALLLDEKKFGEYNLTEYHYNREDYYRQGKLCIEKGHLLHNEDYPYNVYNGQLNAPTIAEVLMWLYEKHGVWINVDVDINGKFRHIVRKYNSNDKAWEVIKSFTISEYCNSPTEAYEAAIKYTLENLV